MPLNANYRLFGRSFRLFVALQDGLLRCTSSILNSSCNGLLLLAYLSVM
jgi:hypothetical protein